jgi:hypothetical protein
LKRQRSAERSIADEVARYGVVAIGEDHAASRGVHARAIPCDGRIANEDHAVLPGRRRLQAVCRVVHNGRAIDDDADSGQITRRDDSVVAVGYLAVRKLDGDSPDPAGAVSPQSKTAAVVDLHAFKRGQHVAGPARADANAAEIVGEDGIADIRLARAGDVDAVIGEAENVAF